LQVLVNSETDEPCAVIASGLRHQDGRGLRRLDDARKGRAPRFLVSIPKQAYAQAIPDCLPAPFPDLALARDFGLRQTALGCFLPAEGRRGSDDLMTGAFIGRIADATRFLSRLFERTARSLDPELPRLGTAALECRLDYSSWPRVGDRFCIQSAFSEIGARSSRRVAHWIFDADTGHPLSTVHTLEVNFDLDARRARPVDPKVPSVLQEYLVERLRP
jgi:acyl-CoA thioesterase FadM